MTSPTNAKRPTVTLQDFLNEIRVGYTVQRINDSEWRVNDRDGCEVVSGHASTLDAWALKIRRSRAQIHVILEAVAMCEKSHRPVERVESAVCHLLELGVDPYDFVNEDETR